MRNNKRSDLINNLPLSQFRQILAQPIWRGELVSLPQSVKEWLCYTDSLTQKLQKQCHELRVEITAQHWQAVSFSKNFANQTVWVREVVLICDDIPTIFAQTILPKETIYTVAQEVLTLGDQPIGLWLFPQQPERLNLEWYRDPHTKLYARCSLLALKGYPFEIKELFLDGVHFPQN